MSQQSFQTIHKSQLLNMLRGFLLDGNYGAAASVVSVLSKFFDKLPEEIWQAGIQIMRINEGNRNEAEAFYQLMIALFPHLRTQIALEQSFYLLRTDQEPIKSFDGRIGFSEDPNFHGYLGVISYSLWRKGFQGSDTLLTAEKHLEKSLALDPSCEMFAFCYLELTESLKQHKKAVRFIQSFCRSNPTSIMGFKSLQHLLRAYDPENVRAWEAAALRCLELDPAADFQSIFLPLARHFFAILDSDLGNTLDTRLKLCELLATRLDHLHDEEPETWGLFASALAPIRRDAHPEAHEKIWANRRDWWVKCHFVDPDRASYQRGAFISRIICAILMDEPCELLRFAAAQDPTIVADPSFERHGLDRGLVDAKLGGAAPAPPSQTRRKRQKMNDFIYDEDLLLPGE